MRPVLQLACVVVPLAAACHTITEDLPSQPSSVSSPATATIPVIKIPVPNQTPIPSPVVVATPTPNPPATPAPDPTSPPNTGEKNRNPVARVACSVYFVECNGEVVPDSHRATSTSVGCKVHLDATTKDASGDHTYREPRWVFSNPGMIDIFDRDPWNPSITGKGRHHQHMYAVADGVQCASFGIDFN